MPEYKVREKYVTSGTKFNLHEDGLVVARRPHLKGAKLLLAEPIERDETYECGAPTGNGTCGRTVTTAGETCWQHE